MSRIFPFSPCAFFFLCRVSLLLWLSFFRKDDARSSPASVCRLARVLISVYIGPSRRCACPPRSFSAWAAFSAFSSPPARATAAAVRRLPAGVLQSLTSPSRTPCTASSNTFERTHASQATEFGATFLAFPAFRGTVGNTSP